MVSSSANRRPLCSQLGYDFLRQERASLRHGWTGYPGRTQCINKILLEVLQAANTHGQASKSLSKKPNAGFVCVLVQSPEAVSHVLLRFVAEITSKRPYHQLNSVELRQFV